MVGEFVLLEVRESNKGKGGEERGALVYRSVVYSFPDLHIISINYKPAHACSYCPPSSLKNSGAVQTLKVLHGVAVLYDTLASKVVNRRVIGSQRIRLYLHATRSRRVVARQNVVQAEHLTRGVVEFIMVDLDMGERGVELDVHVALPGRVLDCGHGEIELLLCEGMTLGAG